MRIRQHTRIGIMALVMGCLTTVAQAQQENAAQRFERQLRQAERDYVLQVGRGMNLGERVRLDYGAELNYAFMAIDDTDQSTHLLNRIDTRLFGLVNLDNAHQFYGRLRFDYRQYNEGDSFTGDDYNLEVPLSDRYWYRFDLRRAIQQSEGRSIDDNLVVQIGRQYVQWASGMTFADELYAVRGWAQLAGLNLELQGLFGYTPESSFYDIDSSRPSYDGDTQRFFFGGQVTYTGLAEHKPYFFYLGQRDNNDEDQATILFGTFPPLPYPTRFEYDSNYFGVGSTGQLIWPQLRYKAEFVYQTGSTLSTPFNAALIPTTQTKDDIKAWAARAQLAWMFQDENLSKIEFESILASGDDDRFLDTTNTFGGNALGTTDRAFNAFGYANTGLAFAAPISNLMLFRIGASTNPLRSNLVFRRLRMGTNLFILNKLDANAPLDEPTRNRSFLGIETDFFVDWQIASDVTLRLRYGLFFPGSGIDGDRDPRNFFYTGVTYAF